MEKSCRVRSSVGIIKLKYMNSFRIVESWLCEKGYEVLLETDGEDAVYFDCSQIVINSRNHIEKRLYILLHECGHILINNNSSSRVFSLSHDTAAVMGSRKVSRKRRVAKLTEEIEAWRRGEALSRRLGIKINEEKFDKIKADAIISYVEWARD